MNELFEDNKKKLAYRRTARYGMMNLKVKITQKRHCYVARFHVNSQFPALR